ncbi:MAG: hypothetical protein KGH57_04025 [Candidatus Micrarchaeota archaeon]|nr:hypothetical protein [Candidatus Micrarchaeota archaeon]
MKLREHKKEIAVGGTVGGLGTAGAVLYEAGAALQDIVRGVSPNVVTETIPKVVKENVSSVVQKFTPMYSGPDPSQIWNVFPTAVHSGWGFGAYWNSTYSVTAGFNLDALFRVGNATMASVTTMASSVKATFPGSPQIVQQFPPGHALLSQGNSTLINAGPGHVVKLTFDGLTYVNGTQQGVFSAISEKVQNVTVFHTKQVIDFVQQQVAANQSAVDFANKHILPLAQSETTLGTVLIAAAAAIASVAIIIGIVKKDRELGDSEGKPV